MRSTEKNRRIEKLGRTQARRNGEKGRRRERQRGRREGFEFRNAGSGTPERTVGCSGGRRIVEAGGEKVRVRSSHKRMTGESERGMGIPGGV